MPYGKKSAYKKHCFKMKGKSPMMKKLIGNQHRLPEELKQKILAAPESPNKMYSDSPMKKYSCKSTMKMYKDSAMKKKMKACPTCGKMTPGRKCNCGKKPSVFKNVEGMKKGSYKGFPIKYPANMTLQDYIRANRAELEKMVARGK